MANLTVVAGLAASWLATLGEVSLRIAVLLCAAWLISLALRRRSAALRHTIWAVSLAAVAAMPLLIDLSPKVQVRTPWSAPPAVLNDAVEASLPAADLAATKRPDDTRAVALDARRAAVAFDGAVAARTSPAAAAPAMSSKAAERLPSLALLVSGIWALGVFGFLARIVIGHLRLRKLALGATEVGDVEELAGRFDFGRTVRFVQSATETMPMTWGWRKPVVVLPASFAQWEQERRAMTVYHELAHVRRADWLTQTLAQAAGAFYWFHPLVWLGLRRLRIEADCACDDLVLASGVKASGYAGHLVQAAREFRGAGLRPWVAIAMAHPSSLDQRVQYVLDDNVERGGLGRFGKLAAAIGVAGIVLMVPSVEAVGRTESAAPVRSAERALERLGTPAAVRLQTSARELLALQQDAALLAQAEAPADRQDPSAPAEPVPEGDPGSAREARRAFEMDRLNKLARQKMERAHQASKDRMDEFAYELLKKAEGRQQPRLSAEALQTAGAALRRALGSSDANVRAEAAEALGNLGSFDEANLQALAAVLTDSEPHVQKNAVESLGRLLRLDKNMPGDRAVGYLTPAVSSADAELRREAAEALGRLRGAAAIGAATKLVADTNRKVQREAVESLGMLLHRSDAEEVKSALPVLRKALEAKDGEVRRQVVETLGGLRAIAEDVIPLLAQATEDPDPHVQREAVEALGKISSGDDDDDWAPEIEGAIEGFVKGAIVGGVAGGIEGGVGAPARRAMPNSDRSMDKADQVRRLSGEI